ncbi:cuticle protein 6.4-like [Cimex lectularius]|uniref:Uncharacterized protein n=1 Tax=Cimex lectularius TaxID=79782 RepID=A0A8I6RXU2_CIMLE|nr:cuticle protein 6.4-like [Cimex lectularius]
MSYKALILAFVAIFAFALAEEAVREKRGLLGFGGFGGYRGFGGYGLGYTRSFGLGYHGLGYGGYGYGGFGRVGHVFPGYGLGYGFLH